MLSCRFTCPRLLSHLPPLGHLPQDTGANHLYYCLPRCPLWLDPYRHSSITHLSNLEAVGAYKISGCLASVVISYVFRESKAWLWLRWNGWMRWVYDIPFAVCSPVHYFKLLVHFSHTSGFAPSETWIVLIVCGYHAIMELLAKLWAVWLLSFQQNSSITWVLFAAFRSCWVVWKWWSLLIHGGGDVGQHYLHCY